MRTLLVALLLAACSSTPSGESEAELDADADVESSDGAGESETATPTTTALTTSETSTDSGEDDDAGFASELDFGACHSTCNPYEPSDCDPGESCKPSACSEEVNYWDRLECLPVMGDRLPGESCSFIDGPWAGLDDCVAGSFCANVDAVGLICLEHCTGSPGAPSCPLGSSCRTTGDGLVAWCEPE